jgi:hypothetical protein
MYTLKGIYHQLGLVISGIGIVGKERKQLMILKIICTIVGFSKI